MKYMLKSALLPIIRMLNKLLLKANNFLESRLKNVKR